MSISEKLLYIQSELKAPKNQRNSFGNYNYRSAEDILEALKPLLVKHKVTLIINDEIIQVGERYYVKATARLIDAEDLGAIEVSAYAREDESKKGQDLSQLTGSTSSYARKYALNGLFAIDDTKDSDYTNKHDKEEKSPAKSNKSLSDGQVKRLYAIGYAAGLDANTINGQVKAKFKKEVKDLTKEEYDQVCSGYEKLKK